MLPDNAIKLPVFFKKGHRALMLLHRPKDGEIGNAQRKAIKRISSNEAEWDSIIIDFYEKQMTTYPNHRIYASVNERDFKKAIIDFKMEQLKAELDLDDGLKRFYANIENRFFSSLSCPFSRGSKFWLIDCDNQNHIEEMLGKVSRENIVHEYPTKNGKHFICTPFNRDKIYLQASIHVDGMLAIN